MIAGVTFVLFVVRLVSLFVAVQITVTSYRAYRRTGEPTFGYTMVGFGFLGLGLGVESVLLRTLSLTITEIHTVESVAFAAGFVALYVSIAGRPGR